MLFCERVIENIVLLFVSVSIIFLPVKTDCQGFGEGIVVVEFVCFD